MKILIYLFILVISLNSGFAQTIRHNETDSTVIRMPDFYKGFGKVFPNTDQANRDFAGTLSRWPITDDYKSDIELCDDDLVLVEKLLQGQFSAVNSKLLADAQLDPVTLRKRNDLRWHYRQYVGYEDQNGDRMVLLLLLNFRKKRVARKSFELWKEIFAVGSGDWYYRNQHLLKVNLTQKKLIIPGVSQKP